MIGRCGLRMTRNRELDDILEAALSAYRSFLEDAYAKGRFRNQPAFSYGALVKEPATGLPGMINRLGLGSWESMDDKLKASLLARPEQPVAKVQMSRKTSLGG